jgi:hypothetical protein
MPICNKCNEWHSIAAQCPPVWKCWDEREPDDYSGEVRDWSAEAAASKFVERTDSECGMEYTFGNDKNSKRICVQGANGKVMKFLVSPEPTIEYHTWEIEEDENSDVDSDVQSTGSLEPADREPE